MVFIKIHPKNNYGICNIQKLGTMLSLRTVVLNNKETYGTVQIQFD